MPPVQDVATFLAMRDQGLPLLDVRSPGEFAFAHIPGALNLPLFTDEERAAFRAELETIHYMQEYV